MKALLALTVLLSATSAVQAAPEDAAQTAAVVEYLAAHAIPLKTVEAGHGFDDLKPLKKVLKDARIVGLGEATHGTREFFQFKHRMLEFLVKEMGFRVFAIESSYVACLNINDYVVHGKGDPAAALASQKFWTWDTEEVSAMIAWMHEYNKDLPEAQRVRFMGYDIQAYDQAFDVIAAYLAKVSPQYLPKAEAGFKPLRLQDADAKKAFAERSREEKNAEAVRLMGLIEHLERYRTRFVRETSGEEYEKVLQHARILFQYHAAYTRYEPEEPQLGARDRFMAQNIRQLMDTSGPKTKMVVWAHNFHVSDDESSETMGSYLRQWYGPSYYILGFAFNQGSFQSIGEGALREFTLEPAPQDSVPWYFERARERGGLRDYVVDFRSAPKSGPVAQWLASSLRLTSVGSMFDQAWPLNQYMSPAPFGSQYDGMVFIHSTTRARPNPTGMRPPPK